jgi:hypothetical protein
VLSPTPTANTGMPWKRRRKAILLSLSIITQPQTGYDNFYGRDPIIYF